MRSTGRVVASALLLLGALLQLSSSSGGAHAASVLAIDYGTHSFKACLLEPGAGFDVLLNRDSKRKTPSAVGFKDGLAKLAAQAESLATRAPKDTFASIKLLSSSGGSGGESEDEGEDDDARARLFESLYPHHSGSDRPRYEELLALQLSFAREMAQQASATTGANADDKVKDAVVTVPSWYSHQERVALKDAIELAGLRPVALIHDGTAAAINFAMSRTFTPEGVTHAFYDFGAGSVQATVVSIRSELDDTDSSSSWLSSSKGKNVTKIEVLGTGHSKSVSGLAFDAIVRDLLVDKFAHAASDPAAARDRVRANARAMAKLLKEAERVKHVLSANNEAVSRIESLIDDDDMRVTLSRAEFESALESLVPQFTQPLHDALEMAKLGTDELASVILVGGSSRVPIVQRSVRQMLANGRVDDDDDDDADGEGQERLGLNVNADEAAVLGAALRGAALTRGFKTKDIRLVERAPYAIDCSTDDASTKARATMVVVPAGAEMPHAESLVFDDARDDFTLACADTASRQEILRTKVSGLASVFANETTTRNASVKVDVQLDGSGLLVVDRATVTLSGSSEPASGLNDKLKGLFGGLFGGAGTTSGDEGEPDLLKSLEALNETEREAAQRALDELVRSERGSTVSLSLSPSAPATSRRRAPMSGEEKKEARRRLREIKMLEQRVQAREEARNALEAYVYRVRDMLDSHEPAFESCSSAHERAAIKHTVESVSEWLWDQAETASTKDLNAKKAEISKLVDAVERRVRERAERPRALDAFHRLAGAAQSFVQLARANMTDAQARDEPLRHTPQELDALASTVSAAVESVKKAEDEQAKLDDTHEPAVRVAELERLGREIDSELARLRRKKAPRKRPATTASSSTSEETPTSSPPPPRDEL